MVQLFPLVHHRYVFAIRKTCSLAFFSSGYVTKNILRKDKTHHFQCSGFFLLPPLVITFFSSFWKYCGISYYICSQTLPFLLIFLLTSISTSHLAFTFYALIPVLFLMIIPRLHTFASALSSFIPLSLKWLATKCLLYSSIPCSNHLCVMFWVGKVLMLYTVIWALSYKSHHSHSGLNGEHGEILLKFLWTSMCLTQCEDTSL